MNGFVFIVCKWHLNHDFYSSFFTSTGIVGVVAMLRLRKWVYSLKSYTQTSNHSIGWKDSLLLLNQANIDPSDNGVNSVYLLKLRERK